MNSFDCLILIVLLVFPLAAEGQINRKLIVTTIKNPLANLPNTTTVDTGLIEEICFNTLAERLNFTYEVRVPDRIEAGILGPHGWTGSMGMVERKEAEFCVAVTSPDAQKLKVMDILIPLIYDDTSIIIPFPKEADKSLVLLAPFKLHIWLSFAALMGVSAFVMWISGRIHPFARTDESWAYSILFLIAVAVNQNFRTRNHSDSFRILCALILVSMFIFNNYYVAFFTSMIAVPNYQVLVNSIEDVAANPNIEAIVYKGSPSDAYFQQGAAGGIIKAIGEQLRRHPERRMNVLAYKDISELVHGKKVLISSTTSARSLVQQSYDYNKVCRVTMAEKTFYKRGQSFTAPKYSPLTPVINREILLIQQSGLVEYAKRRVARHNPCSLAESREQEAARRELRLSLAETTGAFALLGFGIALSILLLAAEMIYATLKKKLTKISITQQPTTL